VPGNSGEEVSGYGLAVIQVDALAHGLEVDTGRRRDGRS
jgi:hypothetical protein